MALIVGELGHNGPAVSFDDSVWSPAACRTWAVLACSVLLTLPTVLVLKSRSSQQCVFGRVVGSFDAAGKCWRINSLGAVAVLEMWTGEAYWFIYFTLDYKLLQVILRFMPLSPSRGWLWNRANQGLNVGQFGITFRSLNLTLKSSHQVPSYCPMKMKSEFQFRHVVSCSTTVRSRSGRVENWRVAQWASKLLARPASIAGITLMVVLLGLSVVVFPKWVCRWYLSSTGGAHSSNSLRHATVLSWLNVKIRVVLALVKRANARFLFKFLFGSAVGLVQGGWWCGGFYALGYSRSKSVTGANIAITATAWHYVACERALPVPAHGKL